MSEIIIGFNYRRFPTGNYSAHYVVDAQNGKVLRPYMPERDNPHHSENVNPDTQCTENTIGYFAEHNRTSFAFGTHLYTKISKGGDQRAGAPLGVMVQLPVAHTVRDMKPLIKLLDKLTAFYEGECVNQTREFYRAPTPGQMTSWINWSAQEVKALDAQLAPVEGAHRLTQDNRNEFTHVQVYQLHFLQKDRDEDDRAFRSAMSATAEGVFRGFANNENKVAAIAFMTKAHLQSIDAPSAQRVQRIEPSLSATVASSPSTTAVDASKGFQAAASVTVVRQASEMIDTGLDVLLKLVQASGPEGEQARAALDRARLKLGLKSVVTNG